jgi:hypothetical protein
MLKRNERMKKVVKYGFLIFGIIILIGFALRGNIIHEKFDSEEWKNWTETEWTATLRWDMINSLRNTHELKGKTKTEITELLGEPDEGKSDLKYRYFLGMAKHGIDTGSLIIKFDENDLVTDFYVWHG